MNRKSDQSSLGALWLDKDPYILQAESSLGAQIIMFVLWFSDSNHDDVVHSIATNYILRHTMCMLGSFKRESSYISKTNNIHNCLFILLTRFCSYQVFQLQKCRFQTSRQHQNHDVQCNINLYRSTCNCLLFPHLFTDFHETLLLSHSGII